MTLAWMYEAKDGTRASVSVCQSSQITEPKHSDFIHCHLIFIYSVFPSVVLFCLTLDC